MSTITAPAPAAYELNWRGVSAGSIMADDPNGNGTWHIWINTVSAYSLVHIDNNGVETKHGRRVYRRRQIGWNGDERIMEWSWLTLGFGDMGKARDYAAKLTATTA
ncbi:hypothetical protein PBI_BIGNUZ_71 [Mycobacterium phage BigNuz]|uniref:Uncharacterized protein n=1 Tax=Mycobacterium phage BigNuz TaxID=1074309 RepID=G1JX86_9CAUD|nr:hypothetical protein PBI_BIGNUZ_71 [Mycobacterium phage BigNuz]AEL98233.1 hypothetical protein PBI_BIGNUZ_71 [Mycobacterium phage BigNuz]